MPRQGQRRKIQHMTQTDPTPFQRCHQHYLRRCQQSPEKQKLQVQQVKGTMKNEKAVHQSDQIDEEMHY